MIHRNIASHLRSVLDDTPVVALHGPRQCGKTTLARSVAADFPYVTLDDPLTLAAALKSPTSFLATYPEHCVIDEIQRAPSLFRSIKAEVDKNRRPGRYLLTGSANVLMIPKMADSLAGRMEVVPLWPFSQGELQGLDDCLVDMLFDESWRPSSAAAVDLNQVIAAGGYPEPIERKSVARREAWFAAYVKALIERDVRDLADVEGLRMFPLLLRSLARQAGEPLNITALSRDTGIPPSSVQRYVALLEAVYLVSLVPAWTVVKSGKVAKTSKVIFTDSGILHHLSASLSLENFITMELVKQATWSEQRVTVMHFRSLRSYSVPIVLEDSQGNLVGIHIIDRAQAEPEDFRGLEFLAEAAGPGVFRRGVVIHCGTEPQTYTNRLSAIPLGSVWAS